MMLHCIILHCSTVQYSTVQYSTVRHSTAQHSTVHYFTVLYFTLLYIALSRPHADLAVEVFGVDVVLLERRVGGVAVVPWPRAVDKHAARDALARQQLGESERAGHTHADAR